MSTGGCQQRGLQGGSERAGVLADPSCPENIRGRLQHQVQIQLQRGRPRDSLAFLAGVGDAVPHCVISALELIASPVLTSLGVSEDTRRGLNSQPRAQVPLRAG